MPVLHFLACILTALLFFTEARQATAAGAEIEHLTVLELFTSQGCSSCPPADALMGEYARKPKMIALTYAVDYWDYLGWKDTLAKPAHARRQQAYAVKRSDREVYTPQMVINGMSHAVGSRKQQINTRIKSTEKKLSTIHVPVKVSETVDTLTITIGDAPIALQNKDATLWLVLYQSVVDVTIVRGENRGRKITYYNVVREMTPAGMWHGKMITIDLPKSGLMQAGYDGFALLLQQETGGPILGATRHDLPVRKVDQM